MPIGRLFDVMQSKELNGLLERIEANSKALAEQNRIISELHKEVAGMKDDFLLIKSGNNELSQGVKSATSSVETLNSELQESVTELKIMKTQLQSKVADKIEAEFRILLARFEKDVESIGQMKTQLEMANAELAKLKAEIEKLNKISSGLKTMDFELANYAKKLQADDAEKLRLMRQIDSLERLISKLRRQSPSN